MVPVDNNSFVSDIKQLIEQSRRTAYAAVNSIMIDTYWHIGQRIVEQEQQGEKRAEYGKQIIKMLSKELTSSYGRGWSVRNLQYIRLFYLTYNDLEIVQSRLRNLTWTHILTTLPLYPLSTLPSKNFQLSTINFQFSRPPLPPPGVLAPSARNFFAVSQHFVFAISEFITKFVVKC